MPSRRGGQHRARARPGVHPAGVHFRWKHREIECGAHRQPPPLNLPAIVLAWVLNRVAGEANSPATPARACGRAMTSDIGLLLTERGRARASSQSWLISAYSADAIRWADACA